MSFLLRLLHQIPPLLTGFVRSLSLPFTPRSSTSTDFSSPSESLVIGSHSVHLQEESGLPRDRCLVTIAILPDDVLMEIFNFYIDVGDRHWYPPENTWHALVHVCRRWRYLVFGSPRHLNLQLKYGGHQPLSRVLGAWPVLPVILVSNDLDHPESHHRWDNRVAALESKHYKRFCEIHIEDMTNSRWKRFAAAMQKPFPQLTCLEVTARGDVEPVLPDSFLGGSAPHLRTLFLRNIPFPSIPKLLLSANGLVTLYLWEIPDSGYISPDAMATALTVITRLETLNLWFDSPQSRPNSASRPLLPPTRFVLPALTKFSFQGAYEYLEDLLVRIDTPLLSNLHIEFFMNRNFDVPQLHRLIGQTEEFKTFTHAKLLISDFSIELDLYPETGLVDHRGLGIEIRGFNWQLSSFAQICRSPFSLVSALENLKISQFDDLEPWHWQDDMEWLELLDPFTSVKNLYLDRRFTRYVCDVLQGLSGERATELLPALRKIFVRGFSLRAAQEAMMPFVAARQLSGHPVAISSW